MYWNWSFVNLLVCVWVAVFRSLAFWFLISPWAPWSFISNWWAFLKLIYCAHFQKYFWGWEWAGHLHLSSVVSTTNSTPETQWSRKHVFMVLVHQTAKTVAINWFQGCCSSSRIGALCVTWTITNTSSKLSGFQLPGASDPTFTISVNPGKTLFSQGSFLQPM